MFSLDSTSAPTPPPASLLAELAQQSGAAWNALGAQIFRGELSLATADGTYRFKNGVFLGRAQKPARTFDCPKTMRGMRLVGFLHDEGGLWSLSPRWSDGAHAVLWKPEATDDSDAFILTPPITEMTLEEPDPKPNPEPTPSPWVARSPSHSGVMIRRTARPPSFRQPLPPSMTRIHNAPPHVGTPTR